MISTVTVEVEGLEPEAAMRWVNWRLGQGAYAGLGPDGVKVVLASRDRVDTIQRIKLVRERTNCGLKEAKEAVEACGGNTTAAIALIERVGLGDHAGLRRPWTALDIAAVLPVPSLAEIREVEEREARIRKATRWLFGDGGEDADYDDVERMLRSCLMALGRTKPEPEPSELADEVMEDP